MISWYRFVILNLFSFLLHVSDGLVLLLCCWEAICFQLLVLGSSSSHHRLFYVGPGLRLLGLVVGEVQQPVENHIRWLYYWSPFMSGIFLSIRKCAELLLSLPIGAVLGYKAVLFIIIKRLWVWWGIVLARLRRLCFPCLVWPGFVSRTRWLSSVTLRAWFLFN